MTDTVGPMRRLLPPSWPSLLLPASASAAAPAPFGHACAPRTASASARRPSWPTASRASTACRSTSTSRCPRPATGPFPTIVMLHGYGGSKTDYESSKPEPARAGTHDLPLQLQLLRAPRLRRRQLRRARGFGRSCGAARSRTPDCAKGWLHLADQRYEARDTQYLLGLLADEGIAKPGALGVTGISYGGGQSLELAYLRDRIAAPDGSFAPWRSPTGTPLSITAAYPRWPWSDLVDALLPNGRFLDFRVSSPTESREPIGVADPVLHLRALRARLDDGLLRAAGRRPGRGPHELERPHPGRRALRRRRARDRRRDPRLPPGLRHPGHARRRCCCTAAGPTTCSRPPSRCASTTRCARRPGRAGRRCRSPTSATRAAPTRSTPTRRSTTRARRSSTRYLRGAGSPPAPGQRHRVHPDLPAGRARRRPVHAPRAGPRCTPARDFGAAGAADGQLRRRQPGDRPGLRPDRRRRRRVHDGSPTETAPGTAYYAAAARPATRCSAARRSPPTIATAGANGQLAARLWDVAPGGSPGARHPRRLPPARQPARPGHVPAQRQRLPLRRRPHAAAGAARPRRALLPREQRLVQRRRLEAPGRAAGRRASGLRARRHRPARRAPGARPQAPAAARHARGSPARACCASAGGWSGPRASRARRAAAGG